MSLRFYGMNEFLPRSGDETTKCKSCRELKERERELKRELKRESSREGK